MIKTPEAYTTKIPSSTQKFLALFLPNVILQILSLVYEYFVVVNTDVRGWWPVVLVFIIIFYGAGAMIYLLIDQLSPLNLRYTLIFAIVWTIPFFLMSFIGWSHPIDWLAVNDGMTELTFLQQLGRPEDIFLLVLLGTHAFIRLYRRKQDLGVNNNY